MSVRERNKIKREQRIKRGRRRAKLLQKGLDPKDFFAGRSYIARKV
jgi:hypothetical protein